MTTDDDIAIGFALLLTSIYVAALIVIMIVWQKQAEQQRFTIGVKLGARREVNGREWTFVTDLEDIVLMFIFIFVTYII